MTTPDLFAPEPVVELAAVPLDLPPIAQCLVASEQEETDMRRRIGERALGR